MERIFHYKTTNGHSLTGNEDLFNKGMSYLPVVKKIFGLQWIKQKISYDNPSPQIKINICSNSYDIYLAGPPYGEVKYKQDTPHANYRINNYYSLLDV